MLLDRGWGKAPQPHSGEDDKDIRITIRQIVESKDDRHRPAAQRLGPAAEQRAYGGISTTASSRAANVSAVSLFAPYFRRRNGPNARVDRATKRMRQVSKRPGDQKGEQNHTAVKTVKSAPASRIAAAELTGGTAHLTRKMTCGGSGVGAVRLDEASLGVAGMRHDRPPVVWKPRRTIAFLTETAFQGLPLQLLMPRRSSSAAATGRSFRLGCARRQIAGACP
jgi:hypothetical protein